MTLARSRVRVRAGYEFVSCRRHGDQRLPAGPSPYRCVPNPGDHCNCMWFDCSCNVFILYYNPIVPESHLTVLSYNLASHLQQNEQRV